MASWWATLGLVASNMQGTDVPPPADDLAFDAAPVLDWRVPLPGPKMSASIHTEAGGPLIHGNHIYVGTASDDVLLVLHREDGRLVTRLEASAGVQSTPVIVADHLYYTDTAGTTWCRSLEDYAVVWSHAGGAPILSAPTVLSDRVVVANVENVLVALDAQTGALVWRHAQRLDPSRSTELELYGAPAPTLAGELLLSGFSDGSMVALDLESGTVVWQRRVGEGQYPDIIAEALVIEGAGGTTDAIVSGYTEPLVSIELESRNVRWRHDVGGACAAVLGAERRIYHGGNDGVLRAIDAVTGAIAWEWDSETEAALTQPVLTEAGLLVGASAGGFSLIDVDDGSLAWRFDDGYELAGITAAAAVHGRQAVVLTNAGNLYSFVVPQEEPGWASENAGMMP